MFVCLILHQECEKTTTSSSSVYSVEQQVLTVQDICGGRFVQVSHNLMQSGEGLRHNIEGV